MIFLKRNKKILQYILIFIILICIYFISLSLVSYIPSNAMKENVKKSADYFLENGGEKKVIDLGYKQVSLFHFTNALMINTAYSIDSENPIEAFLTAKKNFIPGVTETIYTETPKDLMSASKYYENGVFNGNAYQTVELYDTVNENDLYESFEYPRYWHGYLVFLRPLLILFNYEQIAILSSIIFIGLLTTCSILIWKKIGKLPAIALIISSIAVDLFIVTESINEIMCFDLTLIFSIFILLKKDKSNILLNFFVFGSITNFFDFLTNPIVTYGIPIIIYFMIILNEEKVDFKNMFFIYLKTSVSWFVGYSLTWISKWVITDIILNRGVIKNAIEQVLFRTDFNNVSEISDFSNFPSVLKYYISDFTVYTIYIICMCMVLFNIKRIKSMISKDYLNKNVAIIVYFINMLIPFVWYIVLIQHSYAHVFFTYRNLMITIFALQIFVLEFVDLVYNNERKIELEKQKEKEV